MQKSFIITLLVCFSFSVYAQKEKSRLLRIKNVQDICTAITEAYHPDADSLKNTCWEGCVFIKFNIYKNRQLSDIAFSQSTPKFIQEALQTAFSKLRLHDLSIAGKADQTYILPFIIAHDNGCGFPSGSDEVKRDVKLEERYQARQMRFNQAMTSLLNILDFGEKKYKSLDCVLLAPVSIGVAMY